MQLITNYIYEKLHIKKGMKDNNELTVLSNDAFASYLETTAPKHDLVYKRDNHWNWLWYKKEGSYPCTLICIHNPDDGLFMTADNGYSSGNPDKETVIITGPDPIKKGEHKTENIHLEYENRKESDGINVPKNKYNANILMYALQKYGQKK